MNQIDLFEFEDKTYDFPFYKDANILKDKMGLGLLVSLILFMFLILGPIKFHNYQEQFILFLVMFIPLLFVTKAKLGVYFRKPELSNIKLILLCLLGDIGLVFILAVLQYLINLVVPVNFLNPVATVNNAGNNLDILSIIFNIFQIIAEELFRVTLFLMILACSYNFLKNRKKAIMISVVVTLFIVGLLHCNSYANLSYCIITIGFGSFFTLYPYLKTKNVLLSVIVHILYNFSVIAVHMLTGAVV